MGDPKGIKIGDRVRMVSTYEQAKKGSVVIVTDNEAGGREANDCGLRLQTLDGKWMGSPCNHRWEKLYDCGCKHTCPDCSKKCDLWESR